MTMNNQTCLVKVVNKSSNPLPQYETTASAGMDIRADFSRLSPSNLLKAYGDCEVIYKGEHHAKTLVRLDPMCRVLIPTGLYYATDNNDIEFQVRPRSGLTLKKGLTVLNSPGTLDSDFRGEVGIIVINLGQEAVWIEDGERIAQLVANKVVRVKFQEVDDLTDLGETDRGTGGFGSTGTK